MRSKDVETTSDTASAYGNNDYNSMYGAGPINKTGNSSATATAPSAKADPVKEEPKPSAKKYPEMKFSFKKEEPKEEEGRRSAA